MGLLTTGPPPFEVNLDERVRIVRTSRYNDENNWDEYYGYVTRTPGYRKSTSAHLSMGVQFEGIDGRKIVYLEGAEIEWLDRYDAVAPAAVTSHKGDTVFSVQTAVTKAGTVGQVLHNHGRIVWESAPVAEDQTDDNGRVVKTAQTLAVEAAQDKIDSVVDALFA